MVITKFSLCVLIAGSFALHFLDNFREKPPKIANDVFRVIVDSSEYEHLYDCLMKSDYVYQDKFKKVDSNKFLIKSAYAVSKLKRMTDVLMQWSIVYVMRLLREYCEVAIEMLDRQSEYFPRVDNAVLEKTRFLHEPEYCIVTAINSWNERYEMEANFLFESLFFFQTIDPHYTNPVGLKSQLLFLRDKCNVYLKPTDDVYPRRTEFLITFFRDHLTAVENQITDFSHKFCSGWKPFVGRHLFRAGTVMQLNDVQNQCPFVRRVLRHETCEIPIQRDVIVPKIFDEMKDPELIYRSENQQYHIMSNWNCDKILSSKYRYQPYNKIASPPKRSFVQKILKKITKRPSPRPNPFSTGKSSQKTIDLSLDALKDALKSNNYYINVVMYYNIMADVMLSVGIREGNTILIGIKLAVQNRYIEKTDGQCARKMRELRSTLFGFKSVFDRLASLIQNEKRIIFLIATKLQLMRFDDRVNSVLRLLDVDNDRQDQIDLIYSEIPERLEDLKGDTYYLADDWNEFEAFHFTESMLNVAKLYSYSVNNF